MKSKIKESYSDKVFILVSILFCCFVLIITLYPFVYVISMSISDTKYVIARKVWLLPRGFSLGSYKIIFRTHEVWLSYYNTIWYTFVGTTINIFITLSGAYALSRKRFALRKIIMLAVAFTMFFSGGIIPLFLLVRKLGLYNTRWAMILPVAISAWNLIIARTFLETIPESLHESAIIDGSGELRILFKIFIPLSKPVLAVLTLFYAVNHWNAYFHALIFLPDKKLQPLQLYVARVLIQYSSDMMEGVTDFVQRSALSIQLKYAVILVTILPILCVYPFLQKYFVKGVLIGALKG